MQLVKALHQVHRAFAKRGQQQDDGQQSDQHAAHAGKQHGRLVAQAGAFTFSFAVRRAQQRAESIFDQYRHQVGGGQHDQDPQRLLGQEGAERDIARQQASQAQDQHRPEDAQQQ
ncbi:hypothetical protein D3C86_858880 [compost metagenome]